jgi:hypothetical protein
MVQYIYQRDGAKYEIKRITAKLVFYCTPRGNHHHIVPRNTIKSGAICSVRWGWYWECPSWPTEGLLGEMYAELRELEKATDVAREAYEKARKRSMAMHDRIYKWEGEEEQARRFQEQERCTNDQRSNSAKEG